MVLELTAFEHRYTVKQKEKKVIFVDMEEDLAIKSSKVLSSPSNLTGNSFYIHLFILYK